MNYILIVLSVFVLLIKFDGAHRNERASFTGQRTCKRKINDIRTLFTTEISRLDAKDMDLMNADQELRKRDEDIQRKFQEVRNDTNQQWEVTRLDEKDGELMRTDEMLMEKNANQDKIQEKLIRRDITLMDLFKELEGDVGNLKEEVKDLKEEKAELQRVVHILKEKALQKTAFDGFIDDGDLLYRMPVAPFTEESNLGGFFNAENGTLTAGCTGLYRISVDTKTEVRGRRRRRSSVVGHRARRGYPDDVHLCLRINGEIIPDTDLKPLSAQFASLNIIRPLNESDIVDLWSKSTSFGDVRFTGQLVHCLNATEGLSKMD